MGPVQSEPAAFCMIIVRVSPRRFPMTVRALRAEIPGMPVVLRVTVMTKRPGDIVERTRIIVAASAGCILMTALQRKVGKCVIEFLGDQPDDVCFTPGVLGMALGAGCVRGDFRGKRVEPGVGREILGDFHMAVETELSLACSGESCMAGFTLGFILRVRLYHRPRHQGAFQRFELCISGH